MTMPERTRSRAVGSSRHLFWFAMAITLMTFAVAQVSMWDLYAEGISTEHHARLENGFSAEPLVVGVGRTPGGPGEWISYAAYLARMQRDLGRPIVVRYAATRSEIQRMLEIGEIDAAFVSTFRYLELEESGVATLVASPVLGEHYLDAAVLVVKSDSPYLLIADLKGTKVAVAMPESLGGHSYLYWLFDRRGEKPEDVFTEVVQGASQDANLASVLKGDVAATVVNRSALTTWPSDSFMIIAESPSYGMPPFVARNTMDAETIARMRKSLTARAPVLVNTARRLRGFTVPRPGDYDFSRTLRDYRELITREGTESAGGQQ